jgi:spore germination protein
MPPYHKRIAATFAFLLLASVFYSALRTPHSALGAPPSSVFSLPSSAQSSTLAVRWGFYVTYNPNSWASLQANDRNLNYVSPWFYYLKAGGQITGEAQPQVNVFLKSNKIKNLPMVQNAIQYNDLTAVLADTNKQLAVVNTIDQLVTNNDYDGITIDFEWVSPADKGLLSAFMSRLYGVLHPKGKLVAMAVAAKTTDNTTGWSAGYDYPALAAVTDYLLIMAYDYHWADSVPGPIAPMDRLRLTADYAVSKVPPSKIIWGIGVYGYDWTKKPTPPTGTPSVTWTPTATPTDTPTVGEGTPIPTAAIAPNTGYSKADYRTYGEVATFASLPDAKSGYDTTAQAPWLRYTIGEQQHEVWYENRRSFDAKLTLPQNYGMAGFGIWRIGQEDPDVWESIANTGPPWACRPVTAFTSTKSKVYFPQTRHSLQGTFLKYWQSHGGLPIYGYPITEEFLEISPTNNKSYKVQYFERNRFEYHPENKPPNDVQLGLLGVQTIADRIFPPADDPLTAPDSVFFPQVQHTLGGPFLTYWQERGGLAQFGYPLSEPLLERSDTDGKTYTVQYLERARFEYHPEYKDSNAEVLLGLLGLDIVPCK